jgi:AcrR family transcriptional regulator
LSVSGQPAPHRTDAARNRERILAAARAALTAADDIKTVTMQSVAQKAGVGQGTLYRHFPTREDLVLAVYHADVERLIAAAAELSAAHPPREAMRRWLVELAAYGRVKRGVSRVVLAAATRQAISALSAISMPKTSGHRLAFSAQSHCPKYAPSDSSRSCSRA